MTEAQGCRLMRHPIKRAMLFNDPTAPCPKGWQDQARPGVPLLCALLNGHDGRCEERSS